MKAKTQAGEMRRDFLKKSAAASLLPFAGMLPGIAAAADRKKVIVIGAGMAGLAAAKKLTEQGLTVTVLEAKANVGGRVYTERSVDGIPMDLGAGWIHGPDPANPITGLVPAGTTTYQTDDNSIRITDANGNDVTATQFGSGSTTGSSRYAALIAGTKSYAAAAAADLSLADAIKAVDANALSDPYLLYPLNTTLEFDKGGWLEAFSAKNYSDDEKYPGKDVLFPTGYDAIPKALAKNLDIRLSQPVTGISYSASGVTVTTAKETFTADYAICTATLGVLKAGSIAFSPTLPAEKLGAISRLGMGKINKLFMVFDSAFWPTDLQYFGYHSPIRGRYSYFLSYKKFVDVNCLVTFGFGQQGAELEKMTNDQLIADVMPSLTKVFGAGAVAPKKVFLTRWNSDPYALGAYSFAAVGSGYDDHVLLAKPVDRLLFAGEHTHEKYRATTHGAYLSGIREADRILAAVPARTAESDTDRVFNWAESLVPDLLTPRGGATQSAGNYAYRFYRGSGTGGGVYLGVDNSTGRIVFYAPATSAFVDYGPLKDYLPTAAAAGY